MTPTVLEEYSSILYYIIRTLLQCIVSHSVLFHSGIVAPPLLPSMESEIMEGFWHSRSLNDRINLFDMIGSFESGTNVSLVAKSGNKKIISLLSIKLSPVDRFQSLRCLNDHIDIPYIMGSLTSGATNSQVAKIRTKDFAQYINSKLMDKFWHSMCLKDHIHLPHMIGSIASGTTSFLVAINWTKELSQPFEEVQGSNLECE